MSSFTLQRPALGQIVDLGSLYDARRDTFIPISLFNKPIPSDAVGTAENRSLVAKPSLNGTYREKFDALGIGAELGVSLLAGLTKAKGSCLHLSDPHNTDLVAKSSMHYTMSSVEEVLDIASKSIKDCLAFPVMDSDVATHVVIGITWGAHCTATAKRELALSDDREQIIEELESQLAQLNTVELPANDKVKSNDAVKSPAGSTLEVTVYGDTIENDKVLTGNLDMAQKFITEVLTHAHDSSGGKGLPLVYSLMPLPLLATFRILEIKANTTMNQPSPGLLQEYVQLFDDIRIAHQKLNDYHIRLQSHSASVLPQHINSIEELLTGTVAQEASLKSDLAKFLDDFRSGHSDDQHLRSLLEDFRNGLHSPRHMLNVMTYSEKMDFEDLLKDHGAYLVGYGTPSVSALLYESERKNACVLYFSERVRKQSELWEENKKTFLDIAQQGNRDQLVIAVDCDVHNDINLEKPYIRQFRRGRVITDDLLEHRKTLAMNCVMQCRGDNLDHTIKEKPLKRRPVKLPCPSPKCDKRLDCSWICASCKSVVEYGFDDDLLYCDCGAGVYHAWEFRCKDSRHGSEWSQYKRGAFLQLLKDLKPISELNILILGETGVGKSTWINAFINYLSYGSIDEAMQAEELKCVIPCSFQTQTTVDGKFVEKEVKIGSSKSERDGSGGQSATQRATVYSVNIGTTRIRLIDTPGIGDTRGINQDNANMSEILRVLRTYNKLHGILILLKPNAARLTVMFRFCIKQLLTHLHRNAADNIAFGFTNTRGSNYKPGDTFKPLNTLLTEYKDANIGLFEKNVYCFDSESFRFLAACRKGIDMGHLDENRRSWQYSYGECDRLVKHFQAITPHEIRNTINLNETRNTIERLAEPMTLIAEKIRISIKMNDDAIKELQNVRLSREQLNDRLYVQKESLESCEVDKPRTVCTHTSCTEFRSDFEGRKEDTIIYKTVCHDRCYLDGVSKEKKGHDELQRCWAMGGDGKCHMCGHSWMDHMHIYYEYKPKSYRYEDETVSRDLLASDNDIQVKEEAIKMREMGIREFKIEHQLIQDAAIQFVFFLKRHAITPYNDATVEYIDILLKQEKDKIRCGGSKKRCVDLEKYKAEHVEKVEVFKKALESGNSADILDDEGVHQLVVTLYGLPHFGKDLQSIVTNQEKAADATYRERSYSVPGGGQFRRQREQRNGKKIQPADLGEGPSAPTRPFQTYEPIPGEFPREPTGGSVRNRSLERPTVHWRQDGIVSRMWNRFLRNIL